MVKGLHVLPRVEDSWSFLYVEHTRVDQHDRAIALLDASGMVPIPCASMNLLMLGPGTTVTHEAMKTLASHGCTVASTGEEGVRLYASVMAEKRRSRRLHRQTRPWASTRARLTVVRRMYESRFREPVSPRPYAAAAARPGRDQGSRDVCKGKPRNRRPMGRPLVQIGRHEASDLVNSALSTANSCLYGVCHAAIVAAGYSPALGFIHTGKMLSFVFDIADLHKTEVSIPAAFMAAADGSAELDAKVRHYCQNQFHESRQLARIVGEIDDVLDTGPLQLDLDFASSDERPAGLWDPQAGEVKGGTNYASERVGGLTADLAQHVNQRVARRKALDVQTARPVMRASRRR